MKRIKGVELYIHGKFMEEDGDGMNLIFITEERKSIRSKMKEIVSDITPAEIRDKDNIFYYVTDLNKAWKKAKKILNYKESKQY